MTAAQLLDALWRELAEAICTCDAGGNPSPKGHAHDCWVWINRDRRQEVTREIRRLERAERARRKP